MRVDYTERSAKLTDRERAKLDRKLAKIQRILTPRRGLQAHVKLSRQRHLCEAEVTLRALRHTLVVTSSGISAFAALHRALDKLEKQALRNKRKIIDSHRLGRQRGRPSALVEQSLQASAASGPRPGAAASRRPRIVASPTPRSKPMTAEEALMALEESGREYVSFRDADSGSINVLVRLRDGSAELVEGG